MTGRGAISNGYPPPDAFRQALDDAERYLARATDKATAARRARLVAFAALKIAFPGVRRVMLARGVGFEAEELYTADRRLTAARRYANWFSAEDCEAIAKALAHFSSTDAASSVSAVIRRGEIELRESIGKSAPRELLMTRLIMRPRLRAPDLGEPPPGRSALDRLRAEGGA